MSFYTPPTPRFSFAQVLAPFFGGAGLPFADVLTADDIADACRAAGVAFGRTAAAVFTPAVTLWAFLSQVLDADKACRAAVRRVCAWRVGCGLRKMVTLYESDLWKRFPLRAWLLGG